MKIIKTKLRDCLVIEPKVFGDDRGFFFETFQAERYAELAGIEMPFVQDNHSRSSKGVLRGLHFQRNNPQGKLARVTRGKVFDVAIDCRLNSSTFGRWESVILSGEMMLRYMGWNEAADLIVNSMDKAFSSATVTYDFARQMNNAKELKCSEFGDVLIKNM